MNRILCLSLFLFSLNVVGAVTTLTPFTIININELYENSITNVFFSPSSLKLEVSDDGSKFNDSESMLNIETNIPKVVYDIPYSISFTEISSKCIDLFDNEYILDNQFLGITVDSQSIGENYSVTFSDFNSDDGIYKSSNHRVALSFMPFSEIGASHEIKSCSGKIATEIGVEI
ncbi:MAG: hypothetical protein HWE19_17470 [Vibrionaceae bacterium]|nr:hypothetical protein [Vibrionaceae bacterium]